VFERRLYHHIDWAMVGAIVALCLIGLAQIYSTTSPADGGASSIFFTQIWGIVLGLVALAIVLGFDYRSLADKSHFLYVAIVALLVGVLIFGVVRGGSRRWIDLGPMNLQPSEFAKATLALVLAKFFGESRRGVITRTDFLIAGAIAAVPLLLIAQQPDLGTAVTLLPVVFAVAFLAGMPMASWRWSACWPRPSPGDSRCRTIRRNESRPSSTRRRTHAAPGISRFRPASRWDPAGPSERGSRKERRASCGSSRWHTTTSSSRRWPRSMDSWASSWRSRYICL
jgi:hypothetical protein